jgi:hypothetical protein
MAEKVAPLDELKNLTSVLTKLNDASNKLITTWTKLMKEQLVDVGDSDLVDMIVKLDRKLDKNHILESCRELALKEVQDAKACKTELTSFVKQDEQGKFSVNTNHKECPFLSQVWSGDIYDSQGIQGLNDLITDIQNQTKRATVKYLAKKCAASLGLKTKKKRAKMPPAPDSGSERESETE